MKLTIYQGDCLEVLPTLPAESVDLVITSPPYWGMRHYGTEHVIISGDNECQHEWGEDQVSGNQGGNVEKNPSHIIEPRNRHFKASSNYCIKCGAWRGEHGSEPSMDAYLNNLMVWVTEVWRILKPTGSFVLNIGDCFIGGGRGRVTDSSIYEQNMQPPNSLLASKNIKNLPGRHYKNKQFLSVSSFAYCRIISETDIVCRGEHIWCKPNVPPPIRSRIKHSHEKLFWFVKDADKYYFDATPWMKKVTTTTTKRVIYPADYSKNTQGARTRKLEAGWCGDTTMEHSWRVIPVGERQDGFELTDKGLQAHVAPFPTSLILPYITSHCPTDGVILDPFLGSGTVMRLAMENNRSCIGIELNPEYVAYAKRRVNWGNPMGHIEFEEVPPTPQTSTIEEEKHAGAQ